MKMKQVLPFDELNAHLFKVVSNPRFLKMEGLNQDMPFFLCPYHSEDQRKIDQMIPKLLEKLSEQKIKAKEINLYDLSLSILRREEALDQFLAIEEETDKDYFWENLEGILDIPDVLMPAMEEIIRDDTPEVLFLTGVGEVYPYIRAHLILENMRAFAPLFPTILFFPGEFVHSYEKGASLRLFGEMSGDNYYRAYDITEYER